MKKRRKKELEGRDNLTYSQWCDFVFAMRNKDGQIDWRPFWQTCMNVGEAVRNGEPSDKLLIGHAEGKSSLVVMYEYGVIDSVKIQPVEGEEPILCFCRSLKGVADDHVLTVWQGKIQGKDFEERVSSHAFTVLLSQIHEKMPFRGDVSPMREALPRLRAMGFMPDGRHRGFDQREEKDKKYDALAYKCCIEFLTKENSLPSQKEADEWFGAKLRNPPDSNTIHRSLERVVLNAIEHAVLLYHRSRHPVEAISKP